MKKIQKFSLIALAMAALTTSSAFAAPVSSKPLIGSKIKGFVPYMESIGSRVVVGGIKDVNGEWTGLEVGDVIDIPSHLTGEQLAAMGLADNFKLADRDGDVKAGKGSEVTINGQTFAGTQEFSVTWYAITPKEGQTWETVDSWDKIDPVEIAGQFYEDNQNSKALIVPPEAAGKRIGFIAIPTTETGLPNKGIPVKAWDLSKIWKQEPPTTPGECEEGDENCGGTTTPGGENPGGGGGDVGAPDAVINIYNQDGKIVRPGDDLFVTSTYYATIQIKEGENYREPNAAELATLTWDIVNPTDGTPIASYTATDNSDRVLTTADAVKAPTGLNRYAFTTQTTNDNALDALKILGPNYSEQGWSLSVTIEPTTN